MIDRVVIPFLVSTAQLVAAGLALGRPDLGPALAFLGGTSPSAGETLAALVLLVWAIVIVAVAWSLVTLVRELGRQVATSRRFREGSALATGVLILVTGAAHHVTYQVPMSGGSISEAQSFLGR